MGPACTHSPARRVVPLLPWHEPCLLSLGISMQRAQALACLGQACQPLRYLHWLC